MPIERSTSVRAATLGLAGLAGGLFVVFDFLARIPNLPTRFPEFLGLILVSGALYLAGIFLVENFQLGRAALWVILAGAVAFRLSWLPLAPKLSQDVYRYQWEGRVERLGINPYTVFPDLPGLRRLQDPAHPIETGRATPTLYPPLSEAVFAWFRSVPDYKRLFTALDLATVGLLILVLAALRQPIHRVLTYAWNPTVLVAFSLDGHHDSLAILTLIASLFFIIGQRRGLSIAFLGLSFLAKFFPAVLLPAFLRQTRSTYALPFAVIVALAYGPFLGAGPELFHGLSDYARGWEANDSLFRLLRLAGNTKPQAELVSAVMVLGLIVWALKKRLEPPRTALLLISALLFLSPNAFPWYFTWIVPFLCFYPSPPLLLMTVTCVLGYSPVIAYVADQPYRDSPLILALEYAPMFLWLVYEGWRAAPWDRG